MTLERNVRIISDDLADDLDVEVGTVVKALKASDCWTDGQTWSDEDGAPMEWSIFVGEDEAWYFATASDVEEVK